MNVTPAKTPKVPCPHCRSPLPGAAVNTPDSVACPECERTIRAFVFPAQLRSREIGRQAEAILEPGMAGCFYHEGKKAVTPCDGCGRFLCALCDAEMNGRHLCPGCLIAARQTTRPAKAAGAAAGAGADVSLISHQAAYDTGALTIVFLSMVMLMVWPIWILTAPLAIGLAVYSFFRPASLTGRGRGQAVITIVVALLQLAFCAFVLSNLAGAFRPWTWN